MDSGIRPKFSLEKILIQSFLTFGGWLTAIWLVFPGANYIQLMLGAIALTVIHTIMRRVFTVQETPAKATEISESYIENE